MNPLMWFKYHFYTRPKKADEYMNKQIEKDKAMLYRINSIIGASLLFGIILGILLGEINEYLVSLAMIISGIIWVHNSMKSEDIVADRLGLDDKRKTQN